MPPNVICAEENTGGRFGEGGVGGGGCVQITLFQEYVSFQFICGISSISSSSLWLSTKFPKKDAVGDMTYEFRLGPLTEILSRVRGRNCELIV